MSSPQAPVLAAGARPRRRRLSAPEAPGGHGTLTLAPQLYWLADGRTWAVLGVPAALAYFLVVQGCIAASIVVADLVERGAGGRPA